MRTLTLCCAALLCVATAYASDTKTATETPAPHPAHLVVPEPSSLAAAFSVDMHMRDEGGKEFVITRLVDGGKNRMEMSVDGRKMTMISLDDEAKTTYMVDDESKTVMKMSAAKQRKLANKADEPSAADPSQARIESLGTETVKDRPANKYKMTYPEGEGLMWTDAETNLPLRMESQGKTVDFTDYKFGAQPAEKFAPPKGYEVRDMDEMMARMRGMGGMGGMAKGLAGGMGGSLGGAIGGALGGPIGSMVGQYVGSKIGQKVGQKAASAVIGH